MQCHKAYSTYQQVYTSAEVDYRSFMLLSPASDGDCVLLFAPCDRGKSVTVNYTYTATDGGVHGVVGKTLKISEDRCTDIADKKLYYVTLVKGTDGSMDPNSRIVVTGSSFKARVIWRDGKRWRFVDMDTSLTRSSTP